MTKFVTYVSDEAIEKDAQALLGEYAHARGVKIEPPIAIDDIIEKHLKIGIEFDDTHRLFGVPRSGIGFDPDILGAIFVEQKRIVIDESLYPDANPAREGRYRYSSQRIDIVTPGRFSSRAKAAQSGSARRRWPCVIPIRPNSRVSRAASVMSSASGHASPAAAARFRLSWIVERATPRRRPISRALTPSW